MPLRNWGCAPQIAAHLREIDAVVVSESARQSATARVRDSEYDDEAAPSQYRVLRAAGLLRVRESALELLDPGACEAFAVADHQIAHVYVKRRERVAEVQALLSGFYLGVERVLDLEGKREFGLDHDRSGESIALSASDRWLSYHDWLDDVRAPDFARTVEIHRKPGYDPVELFVDPGARAGACADRA